MKKVIKYILIVVLILFVIFVGFTLRKFLIIHNIENNLAEISKNTNYYIKITDEDMSINGYNEIIYRGLDNKKMSENGKNTIIQLAENEVYTFDNEKKIYLKSEMSGIFDSIEDMFSRYFANLLENEQSTIGQLKIALKVKIKEVDFRGTESYAISYNWKDGDIDNLSSMYIAKDSLLLLATELNQDNHTYTTTYEIKFDTQTEEDFLIEDLLEEYTNITPQE